MVLSNNSISECISKRIESRVSKSYSQTHVHSSTIHKSQEVKATQMSIDGWMDKQNMAYTYNSILFSLQKEGNSDTCYNMDENWGHYIKWNKSVTKKQILYYFTYMRYLK